MYSKRFTSQERLCHDVADELTNDVRPRGVAVSLSSLSANRTPVARTSECSAELQINSGSGRLPLSTTTTASDDVRGALPNKSGKYTKSTNGKMKSRKPHVKMHLLWPGVSVSQVVQASESISRPPAFSEAGEN